METFRLNQRLSLVAKRILALAADKRQACLAEVQEKLGPEQWDMMQKTLAQQQEINLRMQHPLKMPLGNMQRLMWSIELASGYSKNEVTSMYFEGSLDSKKLEETINTVINKHDIFHFRAGRYIPLAKKRPVKKIEFIHFSINPNEPQETQLEAINRQVAQINVRKTGNDLCACLVHMDENLRLVHLVVNHKMIDARTKTLLWQAIWQTYHGAIDTDRPTFRHYLHEEGRYYTSISADLQEYIQNDYGLLSPCEIDEHLIDKETTIKKRHFLTLEHALLERLKDFALQHDVTLDELVISAFIAALGPYCLNNSFFIQLISQPHFSQHQDVFGPSLNERFFAVGTERHEVTDIIKVIKEKNRQSLNYSNLPYGAGLGWLYHAKYKKSAAALSFFLYHILRFSRYTMIDKSIADCYAGLITYEFLANKKCVLPLLSFNFRHTVTAKPLTNYSDQVTAKAYTFPLYRNTENYFSINVDNSEDGLTIHIESHLQEIVDQKITAACLDNLRALLLKQA